MIKLVSLFRNIDTLFMNEFGKDRTGVFIISIILYRLNKVRFNYNSIGYIVEVLQSLRLYYNNNIAFINIFQRGIS